MRDAGNSACGSRDYATVVKECRVPKPHRMQPRPTFNLVDIHSQILLFLPFAFIVFLSLRSFNIDIQLLVTRLKHLLLNKHSF
jgi:hypothetical protein